MKKRKNLRLVISLSLVLLMILNLLPVQVLANSVGSCAPRVIAGEETQSGSAVPASENGAVAAIPYTGEVAAWFEDDEGTSQPIADIVVDISKNVNLFTDAGGVRLEFREDDAAGTVLSNTQRTSADGRRIIYTVDLPAEQTTIYYKLWIATSSGEIFAGSGWLDAKPGNYSFTLKSFVLTRRTAQTNIEPEDFSIASVQDAKGRTLEAGAEKAQNGYTIYTLEYGATYTWATSSNLDGKVGGYGHFEATSSSIAIELANVLAVERTVRFILPEGASIQVWNSHRLFGYTYLQKPVSQNGSTYEFKLKDIGTNYLVKQSGRVSRYSQLSADQIRAADPATGLTVSVPSLESMPTSPIDYASAYKGTFFTFFEDGILMNAPDSQKIQLNSVGDTFLLKTFRASQLVFNATVSGAPEPEYHYEVIAGDSITLDDTVNRNRCLITAKKEGVSLIRVTYDALQVDDAAENYNNAIFNGIDPRQVGLIVVKVGSGSFDTGITLEEYDTVYINDGLYLPGKSGPEAGTKKETASYRFTLPTAVRDAEVKVLYAPTNPLTDNWNFENEVNWTDCTNTGGAVTVNLKEGRNIIRVTHGGLSEYHVVRALKTEIHIENLTDDGAEPAIGDAIRVRFSNLNMPLPKLTKIYNPGYNYDTYFKDGKPTVRIVYDINGNETMSEGVQYNLHSASYMDIYPDDIGEQNFSGGEIALTFMAYKSLGEHRRVPDIGYPDGLLGMAGEHGIYRYSYLPDFSFEVGLGIWSDEDEPDEVDTSKLDYSKLNDVVLLNAPINYLKTKISKQNYHSSLSANAFMVNNPVIRKPLPVQVNGITFADGRSQEDYDIYWRYWEEGNTDMPAILKVTTLPTAALPLKSGTLQIVTANFTDILFGELILIPKDPTAGLPSTTSIMATAVPALIPSLTPYITDMRVVPVGNDNDYGLTDGLLKADANVSYEGNTLDLGYGFLMSERNYTVTVPQSTAQIKLQPVRYTLPQGGPTYIEAAVSVDGSSFQIIQATDHDAATPMGELEISNAINLNEDEPTIITVTVKFTNKLPTTENQNLYAEKFSEGVTYTLTVQKAEAHNVAIDVPENVKISVKNELSKKSVTAQDGGIYSLPTGEYTVTFTSTDFIKHTGAISVVNGEDGVRITADGQKLTLGDGGAYQYTPSLTPAPKGDGTVTVRIVGVDSIVRETTVAIPNQIPDLTCYVNVLNPEGKLSYVRENSGGYTALHAVIDALLQDNTIRFVCVNGKLMPGLVFSKSGHGQNWSWLCRVNNKFVVPAETPLLGGETVVFYYNADRPAQRYAWFAETEPVEAARNRSAVFTLLGSPADGDEIATAVTGAAIYLDGQEWTDVSETDGVYTLFNLYDVPLGAHTVSARIESNGVNALTYTEATLLVIPSESGGGSMSKADALDAVYAAFDGLLTRAYGKESFEAIKAARDAGVGAIQAASGGFEALRQQAISDIEDAAQKYDVDAALAALVPEPAGYASVSMEDYGVRTGESGLFFPHPLGAIIPAINVPFNQGDNMGDVTLRLLEALGIKAYYSYSGEYGSLYLSGIGEFYLPNGQYVENFGEFMSGQNSGWMVSLNDWFINMGVSCFEVADGDEVRWLNTCQLGRDIGAALQSAELADLLFIGSPGILSPGFQNGVTEYIYTIPDSVTALSLEARPVSSIAEAAYESGGISYQAREEIPVADGTVIEIICRYIENDVTLEEQRLTVTVQTVAITSEMVSALIDALPELEALTLADRAQVEYARWAYNALTPVHRVLVTNLDKLEAAEAGIARLAAELLREQVGKALSGVLGYIRDQGLISDWFVVGHANSGEPIPSGYLSALIQEVTDCFRNIVNTSDERVTDHQRRVLAIVAAGGNPRNFNGYDLIERICNFHIPALNRDITFQGLNGIIFALVALDSKGYEVPAGARYDRDWLLEYLLAHQNADGGWDLSTSGTSDPDITSMALIALAPYHDRAGVLNAVNAGAAWLSENQNAKGGYTTPVWGGESSESISQAIIALCANGIDPTGPAYTKNGINLVQALLAFQRGDGAIRHTDDDSGVVGMATEQGYQALLAYEKFMRMGGQYNGGRCSIYHMAEIDYRDVLPPAISTDLKDMTVDRPDLSFIATAHDYEDGKVAVDVLLNGTAVSGSGGRFQVALQTGRNSIVLKAVDRAGNAAILTFTIVYALPIKIVPGAPARDVSAPSGQPGRSVTVTVEGVEYTVDEEIAAVMEDIAALMETLPAGGASLEDIADIFALEQAYQALSEEQRPFVANYGDLETAMENIRAAIQSDGATGVNVTGLPWYVGLKVERLEENGGLWSELQEQAGEEETLLALFEISLIDYVTGAVYEADGEVTVTMPAPDYEGYDGIVILHRKSDGSIEYIQPTLNNDGTITFVLRSFSAVGVLGYKGASPVDLIAEKEAAPWWPWLLVALGVAAVIVVLILRRRNIGKGEAAGS